MRYGLELPCGGEQVTADLLVELGARAERSGWDGVFFEDYLVYYRGDDPPTFDPWVVLTAVALSTRTVTLGTTVTGLLARDPAKLAREAVTLDHLSGGRVVLGVGLGDPADRGVGLVGEPPQHGASSGRRMDEGLELLLRLLAGDPVADDVVFRPPSLQRPRVPVWVGGSSQAGAVVRRAARADGVVPYKITDTSEWSDFTTEEVQALASTVRASRPDSTAPFDIAVGGRRRLPDLDAERTSVDAAAAGGATWWLEFVPPGSPEQMQRAVDAGPVRCSPAGD